MASLILSSFSSLEVLPNWILWAFFFHVFWNLINQVKPHLAVIMNEVLCGYLHYKSSAHRCLMRVLGLKDLLDRNGDWCFLAPTRCTVKFCCSNPRQLLRTMFGLKLKEWMIWWWLVGTVGTRWVKHETCTLCTLLVTSLLVLWNWAIFKPLLSHPRSLFLLFEVPQVFFRAFSFPFILFSGTAFTVSCRQWHRRSLNVKTPSRKTSESGKKEMVWNSLMNLIRHGNSLRGFERKGFRAFTDTLVPLQLDFLH